jgi:hypothetical protein
MEAKGKTAAANDVEMADIQLRGAILEYLYLNALESRPPVRACKRRIYCDDTTRRLHVSQTRTMRAKQLPSIVGRNGTVVEGSFLPRRHAESSVLQRLICGQEPQCVLARGG